MFSVPADTLHIAQMGAQHLPELEGIKWADETHQCNKPLLTYVTRELSTRDRNRDFGKRQAKLQRIRWNNVLYPSLLNLLGELSAIRANAARIVELARNIPDKSLYTVFTTPFQVILTIRPTCLITRVQLFAMHRVTDSSAMRHVDSWVNWKPRSVQSWRLIWPLGSLPFVQALTDETHVKLSDHKDG